MRHRELITAPDGRPSGFFPSAWSKTSFCARVLIAIFKPPYVGPSGWIGAWLDNSPPWAEIEELLRDGWRRRAPKKLAALVGD